ncbi:MAG TPA: DUF5985 family protein [Steroidobacteraceae bacterium]|jgi:hypothetical protein
MPQFLHGVLTTESLIATLFFLKYWRTSRDRLFIYFALSFGVMGLHWLGLALVNADLEHWNYAYVTRLLAFGLIIAGIIDKNRASARTARASRSAA